MSNLKVSQMDLETPFLGDFVPSIRLVAGQYHNYRNSYTAVQTLMLKPYTEAISVPASGTISGGPYITVSDDGKALYLQADGSNPFTFINGGGGFLFTNNVETSGMYTASPSGLRLIQGMAEVSVKAYNTATQLAIQVGVTKIATFETTGISAESHKINNLSDGTLSTDAATVGQTASATDMTALKEALGWPPTPGTISGGPYLRFDDAGRVFLVGGRPFVFSPNGGLTFGPILETDSSSNFSLTNSASNTFTTSGANNFNGASNNFSGPLTIDNTLTAPNNKAVNFKNVGGTTQLSILVDTGDVSHVQSAGQMTVTGATDLTVGALTGGLLLEAPSGSIEVQGAGLSIDISDDIFINSTGEIDLNATTFISANGVQVKNAEDPTDPQDLVTLNYLDTVFQITPGTITAGFNCGSAGGTNDVTADIILKKTGNQVTMIIQNFSTSIVNVLGSTFSTSASATPNPIPAAYRPAANFQAVCHTITNTTSSNNGLIEVLTSGAIVVYFAPSAMPLFPTGVTGGLGNNTYGNTQSFTWFTSF